MKTIGGSSFAGALAVLAACAGLASAQSYPVLPSDGSAPGYTVVADHEPVITPQGVPAFPPGTKLTVRADGNSAFEVFVVGPSALDSGSARHHYTVELDQPGGYKLQYGRERAPYLSQLDFIVSRDPGELSRTTPYEYGF